jgi:ribonuclease T2
MRGLKSHRGKTALAVAVIGALFAWYSQRGGERAPPVEPPPARDATSAPSYADSRPFDFYLLALTWHPAFCADGHLGKSECRVRQPRPLVLHGLWPENRKPGAYPRDCPAARLDLAPALAGELARHMPGMASNLHEHEWRKHGGCSGLGDDEYFQHALDLARTLDAALGRTLTTLAGHTADAADLRAAADRFRPGLGATLTVHGRTLRGAERREPSLVEVRQCVDNDGARGAPGTVLDCATVDRRDQGCGLSFIITGPAR